MAGVSMSLPKQPSWANPRSSSTTTRTGGAPCDGGGGGGKGGVDSAIVRPMIGWVMRRLTLVGRAASYPEAITAGRSLLRQWPPCPAVIASRIPKRRLVPPGHCLDGSVIGLANPVGGHARSDRMCATCPCHGSSRTYGLGPSQV